MGFSAQGAFSKSKVSVFLSRFVTSLRSNAMRISFQELEAGIIDVCHWKASRFQC